MKKLLAIALIGIIQLSCSKSETPSTDLIDVTSSDYVISFNNTIFNNKEGVEVFVGITDKLKQSDITYNIYSNSKNAIIRNDTAYFSSLPIGENVITFSIKQYGNEILKKDYKIEVVKDNSIKSIWDAAKFDYINKNSISEMYLPLPSSWTELTNQKLIDGKIVSVKSRTLIDGMPDGSRWYSGKSDYPASDIEYLEYFESFYKSFKIGYKSYSIDGFIVTIDGKSVKIVKL
ncbi:hypothetical protein FQR65_LT16340 [Abscondita terminalis]|nr:hypothetical protein FQR65_LT16340 [Abscondita terminalis]